jgi:hypothetical protein
MEIREDSLNRIILWEGQGLQNWQRVSPKTFLTNVPWGIHLEWLKKQSLDQRIIQRDWVRIIESISYYKDK